MHTHLSVFGISLTEHLYQWATTEPFIPGVLYTIRFCSVFPRLSIYDCSHDRRGGARMNSRGNGGGTGRASSIWSNSAGGAT